MSIYEHTELLAEYKARRIYSYTICHIAFPLIYIKQHSKNRSDEICCIGCSVSVEWDTLSDYFSSLKFAIDICLGE